MNIQKAYNDWSDVYDSGSNLTRDLDQTVTADVLANLRFKSILELGCGTGKNTAFLSQIGEELLAIDFSEGMLKKAKEKLVSTNVLFCAADMTKVWPCRAGSVELVTCNLVLEHIEHISPVFSEARRTLMTGGWFFVSELHPFRQYQGKKARFERGDKTVEITAFVHHVSEFFEAGEGSGLALRQFREWWHAEDAKQLPRLASFMFQK